MPGHRIVAERRAVKLFVYHGPIIDYESIERLEYHRAFEPRLLTTPMAR